MKIKENTFYKLIALSVISSLVGCTCFVLYRIYEDPFILIIHGITVFFSIFFILIAFYFTLKKRIIL
jgi:uncharacterized membrane protein YfcA